MLALLSHNNHLSLVIDFFFSPVCVGFSGLAQTRQMIRWKKEVSSQAELWAGASPGQWLWLQQVTGDGRGAAGHSQQVY